MVLVARESLCATRAGLHFPVACLPAGPPGQISTPCRFGTGPSVLLCPCIFPHAGKDPPTFCIRAHLCPPCKESGGAASFRRCFLSIWLGCVSRGLTSPRWPFRALRLTSIQAKGCVCLPLGHQLLA